MRLFKLFSIFVLFVFIALGTVGGCGGSGGGGGDGDGPPPPGACQMPALNTDFSALLYLFIDGPNNILVGITSTGEIVAIAAADIPRVSASWSPARFLTGAARIGAIQPACLRLTLR